MGQSLELMNESVSYKKRKYTKILNIKLQWGQLPPLNKLWRHPDEIKQYTKDPL